ncbi:hypothetical protein [Candidatus Poriferisocius sp.]|uniref:hypothetical protein n=1 Tax=Candidatus Poriferisocius sp. TaxID=3101276 RepID=UPI003B51AB0C
MGLKEKMFGNQPFTWWGHGFVTLAGGYLLTLLPWFSLSFGQSCIPFLVFYTLREIGDLMSAARKGKALERDDRGINKVVDLHGDIIGPVLVTVTALLAEFLA